MASDSDLAEGIRALSRAHQSMVRGRRRQASQLRSALREFYPQGMSWRRIGDRKGPFVVR